jgi:hypothetical protein
MMTTVALQPALSAAEAWREVARRRIGLTCALDGRFWIASVEVKGSGHNAARSLRSVSAVATSPQVAVQALIEKLDALPVSVSFFDLPRCEPDS